MKKTPVANSKAAAKPKKGAKANHVLAQTFPEGTLLTDLTKSGWRLGRPIGSGGFGLLYLADRSSTSAVSDSAQFVVKVEPFANGPLFCELAFYQRAAKQDTIREWISSHRLKSLGVPKFIATGNVDFGGEKYRFLVMERFSTDLQKLFESSGKIFPVHSVFLLAIKLLDALEYIHCQQYVHADIKASNLLTGYPDEKQVYLVDYGLAFRYCVDGRHKEYKEDPKRAHDGTVEFTSRDAHRGVAPSRRGDLEILGYCMVQWLCGRLPWEDKLTDKNYVRDEKIKHMSDIAMFMKKCFASSTNIPVKQLSAYLQYVAGLQYDETPDYKRCRDLFGQALATVGAKETDPLNFSVATTSSGTPKGSRKRLHAVSSKSSDQTLDPVSPPARKTAPVKSSPLASGKRSTPTGRVRKAPQIDTPVPAVVKSPVASTSAKKATPSKGVAKAASGAKAASKSALKPSSALNTATPKAKPQERQVIKHRVKRRRMVDAVTTATQTTPGLTRHS